MVTAALIVLTCLFFAADAGKPAIGPEDCSYTEEFDAAYTGCEKSCEYPDQEGIPCKHAPMPSCHCKEGYYRHPQFGCVARSLCNVFVNSDEQ